MIVLFSACANESTTIKPEITDPETSDPEPSVTKEEAWIDSVYNQNWYWTAAPNESRISGSPWFFDDAGSFSNYIYIYNGQGDYQLVTYRLDEVVSPTRAYYSFTFDFNNEDITLYHGVEIKDSSLFSPAKSGLFFTDPAYDAPVKNEDLYGKEDTIKKQWLIDTYSKENIDFNTVTEYLIGVKP